jgi:prolipoprotein diacylglyceryltransferase
MDRGPSAFRLARRPSSSRRCSAFFREALSSRFRFTPTQLYESLAGVVLLAGVMAVRRRQARPGQALAVFALGYAVLRYLIEMVRADPNRGSLGPFSTSQVIALVTFLSASAFLYLRGRQADGARSTPAVTV